MIDALDKRLCQLQQLDTVCKQILRLEEGNKDIEDRIAQIRTCLINAVDETENDIQEDTLEFTDEVIKESREKIQDILIETGIMPPEEAVAATRIEENDTNPGFIFEDETCPDTLPSSGIFGLKDEEET